MRTSNIFNNDEIINLISLQSEIKNTFIAGYLDTFDGLISKAIIEKGFEVPTSGDNDFRIIQLNGVNYLYHIKTFICWWADEPNYLFDNNKITAKIGFGTIEPTSSKDIILGFS